MDGQYLNKINSIDKWASLIINDKMSWEANNLHIDEIDGLEDLRREQWIQTSLSLFVMIYKKYLNSKYVMFLHIPLKPSSNTINVQNITRMWIERNISEYTPPSFNFTSKDYIEEFYRDELNLIASNSIFNDFENSRELLFYYRIFFSDEDMYYNEIYIFPKYIHHLKPKTITFEK